MPSVSESTAGGRGLSAGPVAEVPSPGDAGDDSPVAEGRGGDSAGSPDDRAAFGRSGGSVPPWQASGLRFTCTKCGNCCAGNPHGNVRVTEGELDRIEELAGTRPPVRRRGQDLELVLTPQGDCPLLEELKDECRLCPIHDHQFAGCTPSWPFTPGNLSSIQAWMAAASECPGMNCGELHKPGDPAWPLT